MLILTRRKSKRILIGNALVVQVHEIGNKHVVVYVTDTDDNGSISATSYTIPLEGSVDIGHNTRLHNFGISKMYDLHIKLGIDAPKTLRITRD